MKLIFVFLLSTLFSFGAFAKPPGCSLLLIEPQTLKEVMNLLQDHLNAAAVILYDGMMDRVPEPDFAKAVEHVRIAERVSVIAAERAATSMQTSKAQKLEGTERADYIARYAAMMEGFARLLARYREQFEILAAQPKVERNYATISDLRRTMEGVANKGHHRFN